MCKNITLLCLILFLCLSFDSMAQDNYRFRVYLKDKPAWESSIPPLSEKSMARRAKFNIALDETDYPVSKDYIRQIEAKGFPIVAVSRWMNTVVISSPDSSCIPVLKQLSFVKDICLVWKASSLRSASVYKRVNDDLLETASVQENKYNAFDQEDGFVTDVQVNMLGLNLLHKEGYTGEGMLIAVIDGGFLGADIIDCFDDLELVGTKNFVNPKASVYTASEHGTMVLSTIACRNDSFMGTAPDASYLLLCSEDNDSEYPIEEDFWVAAAEYADSFGVDIITSSLGYFVFDDSLLSHTQSQLGKNIIFSSCGAEIGAQKGMMIVCSAGNEGHKTWQNVTSPSDAVSVLCIGAVTDTQERSYFSSYGPFFEGYVKPDVMALGSEVFLYDDRGLCLIGNGTSFATPLIAGMTACLWQSLPYLTTKELSDLIRASADRATSPNAEYGYGIPNAYKAWLSVGLPSSKESSMSVYANQTESSLRISIPEDVSHAEVKVYDLCGKIVFTADMSGNTAEWDMSHLPSAVYLLQVFGNNTFYWYGKIMK